MRRNSKLHILKCHTDWFQEIDVAHMKSQDTGLDIEIYVQHVCVSAIEKEQFFFYKLQELNAIPTGIKESM